MPTPSLRTGSGSLTCTSPLLRRPVKLHVAQGQESSGLHCQSKQQTGRERRVPPCNGNEEDERRGTYQPELVRSLTAILSSSFLTPFTEGIRSSLKRINVRVKSVGNLYADVTGRLTEVKNQQIQNDATSDKNNSSIVSNMMKMNDRGKC